MPRRTRVVALAFDDEPLASLALPGGTLVVSRGIGSGLARRPGDAPGIVWAVGDRGPNLKVPLAVDRYGLAHLARHAGAKGAKLMPCPAIGPAISELRVTADRVTILRTLPLTGASGAAISGLPPPGGDAALTEPALALDGALLPSDPSGADTEGLAIDAEGGFWVGDEYGPSLLRLCADGQVRERWVPAGLETLFNGADYLVLGRLPAIAANRQLNRGFEALALSPDGRRLHLAFQSPLAHPDEAVHRTGRHARLWTLDATTGAVLAQYLYPFDPPASFRRDPGIDWSDLKVSELVSLGPDRLLVLERASAITRLYAVTLDADHALDPAHLDPDHRPTLEELSTASSVPAVLDKKLVFASDDHPEIGPDLEGVALLDPSTLLLVNDNDFGIEGVATRFWRVELAAPVM